MGRRAVSTSRPAPRASAKVAAGVDRVLADASFRDAAARVGAQLRSLGGAEHAAELLEELL